MTNIEIWDRTPARADVESGTVPQPRERRARENAVRWLVEATAVWPSVVEHFGLAEASPGVKYRPDLKPPASRMLTEFCYSYTMVWHKPPESRSILLLVNEDGTRCAIVDMAGEIARLWDNIQRPRAGRPRIETDNEKTLRQRAWRERKGPTSTEARPNTSARSDMTNTMTVREFLEDILDRLEAAGMSPDDTKLAVKIPGRSDGFCAGTVDLHTFPEYPRGPLMIINPITPELSRPNPA